MAKGPNKTHYDYIYESEREERGERRERERASTRIWFSVFASPKREKRESAQKGCR